MQKPQPRPNPIASSRRLLLILIAVTSLGGCAMSQQQKRFPDIYAESAPERIDLVVDVAVVNDLEGDDLGMDLARNRATADHALERTTTTVRNAGYDVNVARSGYGLTWLTIFEPTYLVENGIATGLPYTGPPADGSDLWTENEARNFLYMLARTGRTRYRDPHSVAAHEQFAALAHMPDPQAFAQLQTRYLMLMNVVVYDAVGMKEFGSAVATLGTAALMASANLFVVPRFRDSFTLVEFTLYDRETETIAWASAHWVFDDGPRDLEVSIGCALMTLPTHEGGRARYPGSAPGCF
ncbi:MAG: hypothetical protein SV422_11740 [Pseudomonadota bacterium]|nr:hypothetical protein [Pseudomonadota bacterium]